MLQATLASCTVRYLCSPKVVSARFTEEQPRMTGGFFYAGARQHCMSMLPQIARESARCEGEVRCQLGGDFPLLSPEAHLVMERSPDTNGNFLLQFASSTVQSDSQVKHKYTSY